MKNKLKRFVPEGYTPFQGSDALLKTKKHLVIDEVLATTKNKLITSISDVFDALKIQDGMTLSFHHHLRNGDFVFNIVLEEIGKRDLKNITLAPSAIFPVHNLVSKLIENGNVTKIYTNYINSNLSHTITNGRMKELLVMDTHGGRARSIEAGELAIDVCFAAAPAADEKGNANGVDGKNACGALGYIIPDIKYAKHKVLVTDCLHKQLEQIEIDGKYVDYVVVVDKIGEQSGIVSGTTKITTDPIGLKIARDAAQVLFELGYIKNGFSMQTGAGSVSLAVSAEVKKLMQKHNVKAKFASGGITGYYVEMLEQGLIEELHDVQCFDLEAVRSYQHNKNHYPMSSSKYANPYNPDVIVNHLDFVILGATEIDLHFNVNVTTTSRGDIIGGSGGHADAAYGADLTMITTNLIKSRLPIIKSKVTTITTPGEDVDILVTEYGIAINPLRKDLIEKLKNTKLKIVLIEDLLATAHKITGVPHKQTHEQEVVGVVRYRDGTIIDSIYRR